MCPGCETWKDCSDNGQYCAECSFDMDFSVLDPEPEDDWTATLRHVVQVTGEDSDVEEVYTAPNKRYRGVSVYCIECLGTTINDCLCIEIIDLTK